MKHVSKCGGGDGSKRVVDGVVAVSSGGSRISRRRVANHVVGHQIPRRLHFKNFVNAKESGPLEGRSSGEPSLDQPMVTKGGRG